MGRPKSDIPYEVRNKAYQKKYRDNNPEKRRESCDKWRKANPEKHAEHSKTWRLRNPEKAKQVHRDYAKRNPEAIAMKRRKRRALLKGVKSENYTVRDIYLRDSGLCFMCELIIELNQLPRSKWSVTIHHIKPLSLGGDDTLDNVTVAHYSCNARLGNRI